MTFSAAKKEIKDKKTDAVPKIQDKYNSEFKDYDSHETIDQKDMDKYKEKVEKVYHQQRKENWLKGYKINYMARHKDQVKLRGPRIE